MAPSKSASAVIDVRKLAALDIAYYGPKLILAEFAVGVFGFAAWGLYSLVDGIFRSHSTWEAMWGAYLLSLGINYMPLLRYGMTIARRRSAKEEAADVLAHKHKYGLQTLFLLIPFLVPALAIAQERCRGKAAAGTAVV